MTRLGDDLSYLSFVLYFFVILSLFSCGIGVHSRMESEASSERLLSGDKVVVCSGAALGQLPPDGVYSEAEKGYKSAKDGSPEYSPSDGHVPRARRGDKRVKTGKPEIILILSTQRAWDWVGRTGWDG